MFSAVRVLVLCLGCFAYTFAYTSDEVLAMDAVFDDFTNKFGDKDDQNAFGAAKGVIENGEGKAYMGGGYWYGTADSKGSSVQSEDGTDIKSKITPAIDATERCLHVIMTTSTSDEEYPYATIGSTLTNEDEYTDVSDMTGLVVTAKGTGTVRINLVTKDYIDEGAEWGFYGFDLKLTASKATTTTTAAKILPAEYSYGDPDGDGSGSSWAADGASGLNKIEIQVKDLEDAELYLYEIKFGGMKYSDFGFVKVPVVYSSDRQNARNGLRVKNSRVNYTIAQPQNLSIQLMNMAGCRVATLFSGNAEAGSHTVPMNLQRMQGVADGQYVIRMNGTNFSASQPIMIAK